MTAVHRACAALTLLLLVAGAVPASSQGIEGQVGRFYDDGGWDLFRLGVSRPLTGPVGLGLNGSYFQRSDGGEGGLAGVALDVTAFKAAGQGPYLVAGVGAGMGSRSTNDLSDLWGSWSAGAGYQLLPASFLSFGAEARYRQLSLDASEGLEVAAGISLRFGGGGRSPRPAPAGSSPAPTPPLADTPSAADPTPASPEAPVGARNARQLREAVVATARQAMGRPYEWGGTGANGGGFDCSGLIQHAYARHGMPLPRISRDQAKEGRRIERKESVLLPGDLLTFSNSGGAVTHVGLYLGDRHFIHSASRGVQVSLLSAEDPYGRWWYKRWVGVRRIVED